MNASTIVMALAFLAAFFVVFSVNLVLTDLYERGRRRRLKEIEQDLLSRQRQRAREAVQGNQERDLGRLAHEAEADAETPTLTERLAQMLEQSGVGLSLPGLLGISFLCGSFFGGIAGFLMGDLLVGIVCGILSAPIPILYVQFKRAQRSELLTSQLPDSLELMSRVLRAGQTITQAMHAVGQEFKPPIGAEFAYCYEQQNLGMSTDMALRDLAKRTGLLEVKIFVLALIIHRQSGGNLTQLLDKIAELIRERYKIRGKIKALTAEGRLQAMILMGLPPLMYCILLLISRKYALELLEHPNLILGALISMAIGGIWIRKIVNFDF